MVLLYFRLFLLAIATAVACTIAIIYSLFRPTNPSNVYLVARIIGYSGKFILGYKLKIDGLEYLKSTKKCVIVSNHQSNFDIFPIGLFLPYRTVSVGKKSILYIPFFGQMFWLTGSISIDRNNRSKAWAAMDKVVDAVKNKNTRVWIMPEGTRSKGKGVQRFKKGAFVSAIKAEAPILPICISSMDKHLDFTKIKSGTLKIKILPPVDYTPYKLSNVGDYAHAVENIVRQEVEKLDNSYGD